MKNKIIILFVLLLSASFAKSQTTNSNLSADSAKKDTAAIIKDTLCFRYKFEKGDSLTYKADSKDSIVFEYNKYLLKLRYEVVTLVCDSVSKDSIYYLRQYISAYYGKETTDGGTWIERPESPWIGHMARFAINSMGKRTTLDLDSNNFGAIVSPAGPFQLPLITPIIQPCKAIDESWLIESDLCGYPENCFPPAVIRNSWLLRAAEKHDTLGYDCNAYSFIRTGQGTYDVMNSPLKMKATSVMNSYGQVDFSVKDNIIVNNFAQEEIVLTINQNGDVQKGKQYTVTSFRLVDYSKGNSANRPSKKRVDKNSKSKNSKKK